MGVKPLACLWAPARACIGLTVHVAWAPRSILSDAHRPHMPLHPHPRSHPHPYPHLHPQPQPHHTREATSPRVHFPLPSSRKFTSRPGCSHVLAGRLPHTWLYAAHAVRIAWCVRTRPHGLCEIVTRSRRGRNEIATRSITSSIECERRGLHLSAAPWE